MAGGHVGVPGSEKQFQEPHSLVCVGTAVGDCVRQTSGGVLSLTLCSMGH
jgi:hypothetical protein